MYSKYDIVLTVWIMMMMNKHHIREYFKSDTQLCVIIDYQRMRIYDDDYIKAFSFKDKKQATYTIVKDQKVDVKKLFSTK